MKFYNAVKKQFVEFGELFIKQYAEAYYYPESKNSSLPLVKGLSRCSYYPEKEIDTLLKDGIKNEEDVVHILAWKIGKISHQSCTEKNPFSYHGDPKDPKNPNGGWKVLKNYDNWASNNSTIRLRKNDFPIKEIAEYVLEKLECWEKYIAQDNWFGVLEDFDNTKREKGWKGLGTVYCITLLYFISKGKYPIFDQFADKALDAINQNEETFPNTDSKKYKSLQSDLPIKEEKQKKFKERYENYCEAIEKLKRQLPEKYRKSYDRDLDRALWVYGHIKCAEDVRE